jgi:hypothetical protein
MKLLVVAAAVVAAACGPGIPLPRNGSLSPDTAEYAEDLAHASQSGDVAAIRRLLGPHTINGGLWFADPTCMVEFAAPGEVAGGRLDELARCLATLHLSIAPRKEILDDVVVMSYAPGFEIEARILDDANGPWVSWIGSESKLDASDMLPTVAHTTLEALRVAGDPHPSLADLPRGQGAWLKVCVDATGAVTGAHVRAATSLVAARRLSDAVKEWRFKPFAPRGQPLPVCTVVLLVNGMAKSLELAPPAIAPPGGEPIILSRFYRSKKVALDPVPYGLRRQLADQRIYHLAAMVMVCVDTSGKTYGVRMIRPSGLPIYDQHIIARYSQAHLEPYRDGGAPVAACAWDPIDIDTSIRDHLTRVAP